MSVFVFIVSSFSPSNCVLHYAYLYICYACKSSLTCCFYHTDCSPGCSRFVVIISPTSVTLADEIHKYKLRLYTQRSRFRSLVR